MLAVRLHEKKSTGQNWGNFCEIGDFSRTFAKLPIDTLAMVAVKATGTQGHIALKDLYTLTLTKNGDTTTILNAIKDGFLTRILDTSLENEGYLQST